MVKIAFVGAGRMGLPVAATLNYYGGHNVSIVDPSSAQRNIFVVGGCLEPEVDRMVNKGRVAGTLTWKDLPNAVSDADVVMVCVQTPHGEHYSGSEPMPYVSAGFQLDPLEQALKSVGQALRTTKSTTTPVVVLSTVLPGTYDTYLCHLISPSQYIYSPLFTAVGSVVDDLRNAEVIIAGSHNPALASAVVGMIWEPVLLAPSATPFYVMSVVSAELAKMTYNGHVAMKVTLANATMELADRVGANVDDVMGVVQSSTRRIVSTRYMDPGMGTGGPCIPRDVMALHHVAEETGMVADPYEWMVRAREHNAEWLAWIVRTEAAESSLPIVILGRTYKPDVPVVDGSISDLVAYYLSFGPDDIPIARVDPWVGLFVAEELPRGVYLYATPHTTFATLQIPPGSIVVDPWGTWGHRPDTKTLRPGREPRVIDTLPR